MISNRHLKRTTSGLSNASPCPLTPQTGFVVRRSTRRADYHMHTFTCALSKQIAIGTTPSEITPSKLRSQLLAANHIHIEHVQTKSITRSQLIGSKTRNSAGPTLHHRPTTMTAKVATSTKSLLLTRPITGRSRDHDQLKYSQTDTMRRNPIQ